MPAISAAEAISPAIERTKYLLFRPFRLSTYLKLCLVALLAEGSSGGSGNFNPSGWARHGHTASQRPNYHPHNLFPHIALTPARLLAAMAIVALLVIIAFVIGYLITRLRFAWFHCLIHNIREIRPGWHIYREPATRFFWFSVALGLCFLALIALLGLPFAAGFLALFRGIRAGGHPDIGAIVALVLPLIPILLLIVILAVAVKIVLHDLMLPHFALENATAGQAWSAAWARIRNEKGAFFVYALLRVLLPVVAAIGLFIVLLIPGILFGLAVAAVEIGLHAAFGSTVLGIFLKVSAGVIAGLIALLVFIGVFGPLNTAVREYALVFYGGRYRPLGETLYPPPPPVAIPAPAIP
ncbi:MAG: hypothetical protein ACLGXA_12905 [Acidobacteriota bacterium]